MQEYPKGEINETCNRHLVFSFCGNFDFFRHQKDANFLLKNDILMVFYLTAFD